MAKKTLLSLLFSLFVANLPILNATNVGNFSPLLTDTCEAPPPDSFRIVDAGAHYVTLAWNPIDPMATYTIVVQKEGANANAWENVDTLSNVSGSSITIQNLLYGSKYQFELATNCGSGDPSVIKVYAGPPIGVILDLVIDGRMPINPVPIVPPCTPILYQNYKWVGFKVETSLDLGSSLNYFEFGLGDDGVPQILRVLYGPQIVATDQEGTFPIQQPPFNKVELSSNTFEIRRVDGASPVIIGTIEVNYNPVQKTVQICKKSNSSWASGYSYRTMVSNEVNGLDSNNFAEREMANNICFYDDMKVLNPISDNQIIINYSSEKPCFKEFRVALIDIYSRICYNSKSQGIPNSIDLSSYNILPGFYTLIIEHEGGIISRPILKL